ncbi:hypothetical protein [Methylobacterium sp. JK268]
MRYHELIGEITPALDQREDLLAEVKPRQPIKPKQAAAPSGGVPPMTPAKARAEAARKQGIQAKISDERRRSSERQADLRAQMNRRPA